MFFDCCLYVEPQTELIMVQQPLQSPGPECDDDEEYSGAKTQPDLSLAL
jgi:hypothetical protein